MRLFFHSTFLSKKICKYYIFMSPSQYGVLPLFIKIWLTFGQKNRIFNGLSRNFLLFFIVIFLTMSNTCAGEERKKILHIDSYDEDYSWSNDISAGIRSVFSTRDDIILKVYRMDTKRNQSEAYMKQVALTGRDLIESWRPDVVIASDDNASKYLIVPYYMNTKQPLNPPFVFCGLNWDASVYGFPTDDVTGMVEVALVQPIIDALKEYVSGERIGYIASDTTSERKEYENIVRKFGIEFQVHFVKTFTELKQAYCELQNTTDMVIIQECRSVKNFNHLKMVDLVNENTRVPTGAMQNYLQQYALLTFAKSGYEQGEYAAKTALEILNGRELKHIPVVTNKKATIYLNMVLARKLGVKFPVELIKSGHMINTTQKKLLYVNSYHQGYKWSDDIEKGLLKALKITRNGDGTFDDSNSEVQLKVFRMDTKMNTSDEFKAQAALKAKNIIDSWQPDIVVTSDDNAAKFLVVPYLNESTIPIVFCGLNWTATDYGFPRDHITGMVEVNLVKETIAMMKTYARGERIGYIGAKVYSEEKEVEYMHDVLQLNLTDGGLVSDYKQWKKTYLRLQNTVDMIVILDPSAVKGWDDVDAEKFVMENAHVPTGSTADNASIRYTLLGKVKIAEEQGWWAGGTALRILADTPVADIPVTRNKYNKLYLNMKLAKKMGIKFPVELLDKATLLVE